MAVRIRMKKLGRKHRPFFRICAVDSHAPRDGRVLEELGTYDPMIPETDARAELNHDRFSYWLGVGAQMSDKVRVLFGKYGPEGTHLAAREAALSKRSGPRVIPDQGAPAYVPSEETEEPVAAEQAAPAVENSAVENPAAQETAAATEESGTQSEAAVAENQTAESETVETEAAESEAEAASAEDAATEEEKSE